MVRRTFALVVLLFALTAAPASAGGPTSVTLSASSTVVTFDYNDSRYGDLQKLLLSPPAVDPPRAALGARFVRATWRLYDRSVWRVDVIYPDAPGGPLIASQDNLSGTAPTLTKPTWHRPTDPAQLTALLRSLNLLTGPKPTQPAPALPAEPTAPPARQTAPPAGQTTPPTDQTALAAQPSAFTGPGQAGFFTGWRWALPGVAVGAALALVLTRLFPKRRCELLG
ncbi:hypothetical protein [Kribbella solani]|uniref:DUF2207 domain-containing protein n=1 Tax=Kribbella solani TaxID=236067 RepID=A0A841DQX2_9ACTN|nr:hypothetical protein [Kribbella solani]MBB5978757.1 hypothetical protein [Kribbella solani]